LRVAGRTSSFAFKGKNEDLREIAEKLNVNTILEGSVRKDDTRNRVRITLQLINASDGYHLWSETYDRDLEDIFAIQEEVARQVASTLKVTLLGEDETRLGQVASTDINAYDRYLRALQLIRQAGHVQLGQAVDTLQQVLLEDPTYTPAKLALVETWVAQAGTGAISYQEAIDRGLPMLRGILETQPENSQAHTLLAQLEEYAENYPEADRQFVRALELDPNNATALGQYGRFLFNRGEQERGMQLIDEAVVRDPLSTRILFQQCQTNAMVQNVEKSLAACARIREIEPDSVFVDYGPALAYLYSGDIAHSMQGYLAALEHDPEDFEMLGAMAMFWTTLGDFDRAKTWLQRSEAIGAGQPVPILARLQLYQAQEQHGLARELVQQTIARNLDDRHGSNAYFRQINAFESLADKEYDAALAPFRKVVPWAFAETLQAPEDVALHIDDLIYVADLLQRADPLSPRSAELIELVRPIVGDRSALPFAWVESLRKAQLAAIAGHVDEAVAQLNRCFEKGQRVYWRQFIVYDPIFSRLKDFVAYQQVVARFEADMERQRELANQLLEVQS
jgi:tetratricopeptide (TPR) repeat protein